MAHPSARSVIIARFSAIASLVRWPNVVLAALGVVVGAAWGGGATFARPAMWMTAAAGALAAFANSFNDYRDADIDAVAHPRRPIPRGALSRAMALRVAAGAGTMAVSCAALAGIRFAAATVVVLVGMTIYSTNLKRRGLPGNALVAVVGSLPFLFGAWTAGHAVAGVWLAILAAPLHFAREVAKDIDDARGDAATRETLPLVLGARTARATVAAGTALFAIGVLGFALRHTVAALLLAPTLVLAAAATVRVLGGAPGGPTLFKSAMICAVVTLFFTA